MLSFGALGALAALVFVFLAGCEGGKPAQPDVTTTEGNGWEVSRLFTVDGCTVYRFHDHRAHYFVRCTNNASVAVGTWTESRMVGKVMVTDHHDEEIPTVTP